MMATPSGLQAASPAQRETVYDAVALWAMRASRRRLAAWAIGGAVDAAGIALVLPGWWLLALPLVSVASIGAWGLAAQQARALEVAGAATRLKRLALDAAKTAAATIGTVAAIAAFYGALLMVLGQRWGPSGG